MRRVLFFMIVVALGYLVMFNCVDTSAAEEPVAQAPRVGGDKVDPASDVTAPTISTLSPADDAAGVDVGTNLHIIFNEIVNVDSGNIYVYKASDDSLVETVDLTSGSVLGWGTDTISINLSNDFASSAAFYVKIDESAIKDEAGNYFAGILDKTSWNFETTVIPPPTVSTLLPADNATDVSYLTNLILTFSETVYVDSGNVKIYKSPSALAETIAITSGQVTGSGTNIITINPSIELDGASSYYVKIDSTALKNAKNINFEGIADTTTWNFQVEVRTFLINESFDYGTVSGDLDSLASSGWSEFIRSSTAKIQYSTTGYSFIGYSSGSGGSALGKNDPDGGAMKYELASDVTNGTLYLGFILDTSVVSVNTGFGVLFYEDTTELGGVSLGGKNPIPRFKILFDDGATTVLGNGTTQTLVILKYDFATDILSAFINPDVTAAEPTATAIFDFSGSPWTKINRIVIDQTKNSSGADNVYYIDELKAVKQWDLLKE